jgi:hypothetical protein
MKGNVQNKPLKPIIIALVIGLVLGFFSGQEYTKYSIRQSFSEAFSDTGMMESDKESESLTEAINKKNDINVSIGDLVELATYKFTVNSVEEKEMIKSSYGQPHLATEGTKFVIADMNVTNTTSETFYFQDSSYLIEDPNGDLYQAYGDTIGNIDDYLDMQDLSPNIPLSGVMVFQLPNSVNSYELLISKTNTNDIYKVRLK